MFSTIESVHVRIIDKIDRLKKSIDDIREIYDMINNVLKTQRSSKKNTEMIQYMDGIHINILVDSLEIIEKNYLLSVVSVLGDYYGNVTDEEKKTKNYYRIITSENFASKINDLTFKIKSINNIFYTILQSRTIPRADSKIIENIFDKVNGDIDTISSIKIDLILEKRNYEICKCGARMIVVPELSELHCPTCNKVKTIIGAVFRDDQFYPQDGQKTKHGGYDTSRHYKFWIERLQALENKIFEKDDLDRIEYVINRDNYDRPTLTCENMREILKDSSVGLTAFNDHVPLLVKTFGGLAPPQLDFQENKVISIRFNKAMRLYDMVNPDGGNKPYYPYFIYKIIEEKFKNNKEKLRLLDYIHLQSRETVIKNDKAYKDICALSNPGDGLVYVPTDPAGRI